MTIIPVTDISNFMAWWINQVARIFLYTFTTLDNIQFAGTSVLRVMVFVVILSALINIMVTTPGILSSGFEADRMQRERRERHRQEQIEHDRKAKKDK